jgi:hypothetical protein
MGSADQAVAKLDYMIRSLERLAVVPRQLAVAAAPEITRLQRAQYAAGTDPYGKAWKALAASTIKKGRRPPPLTDTRRMKNTTITIPLFAGRIGLRHFVHAPYGIHHQHGAPRANLPKREILPTRGLPPSWRIVLDAQVRVLAGRAVA